VFLASLWFLHLIPRCAPSAEFGQIGAMN
jgi:hypothetical protein